MPEPLWQLDRVTMPGLDRPRMAEVSLGIEPGVTAVMGPSGAGKSSLLNLLVGYERPGRGRVRRLAPLPPDRLPVYWVPPDDGLWPHLTVRQHIERVWPSKLPAAGGCGGVRRHHGAGVPKDRGVALPPGGHHSHPTQGDSIIHLLHQFDLADKLSARPEELSQGQRSRLAVVRALATQAAVLVMDEPLVHVDPARAHRYWEVLAHHLADTQTSLIFATHDPRRVLALAQRVVCLRDGQVAFTGTVDELYHTPPTRELAQALGDANWFEDDEAGAWLMQGTGMHPNGQTCIRPEMLTVELRPESELVVQSSRFLGNLSTTVLQKQPGGETRRFFHRPTTTPLVAGERVIVKLGLWLLALMLLTVTGCRPAEGPALPVRDVTYWSMPASGPQVPAPRAAAMGRAGEVLALDTAGRVLVFGPDGKLVRHWEMPAHDVGNPEGLCMLHDGRIVVADTHYHRLVFFDPEGQVLQTVGEHGRGPGQFIYPVAVTQDAAGNIYVCEYGSNDRVQKFTGEGEFLMAFGGFGTGPGEFQRPSGIVWHEGTLYVADAINNRIQAFTDEGEYLGVIAEPGPPLNLYFPYDLAKTADGKLVTVEYGAGRVTMLDRQGRLIGRFGGTGVGAGQFVTPWGLTVDDQQRIRVADTGNRRIVELKL